MNNPRIDAQAVGNVVCKFARDLGCNDSNSTAAVAWGIKNGFDTFSAIRAGKTRAHQLRIRELSAAVRAAPNQENVSCQPKI